MLQNPREAARKGMGKAKPLHPPKHPGTPVSKSSQTESTFAQQRFKDALVVSALYHMLADRLRHEVRREAWRATIGTPPIVVSPPAVTVQAPHIPMWETSLTSPLPWVGLVLGVAFGVWSIYGACALATITQSYPLIIGVPCAAMIVRSLFMDG